MKNNLMINDKCVCGSGKAYKLCCLDIHGENNVIKRMQVEANRIAVEEEVKRFGEYKSIEKINKHIRSYTDKMNKSLQPDFIGFSPDQMHRMINFPYEKTGDIIEFRLDIDPDELNEIPVVVQTNIFLKELADIEPAKATKKGNLPLKLVNAVHKKIETDKYFLSINVRSEVESCVFKLRHFLKLCGYIKMIHNKFRLTQKGHKLLKNGFTMKDYLHLFKVYSKTLNWGALDRYPESWIVQGSFLFSLYILKSKAVKYIEAETMVDYFMEAFPSVLHEFRSYGKTPFYNNSYDALFNCYELRLIEKFCEYSGLVDLKKKGNSFLDTKVTAIRSPVKNG